MGLFSDDDTEADMLVFGIGRDTFSGSCSDLGGRRFVMAATDGKKSCVIKWSITQNRSSCSIICHQNNWQMH